MAILLKMLFKTWKKRKEVSNISSFPSSWLLHFTCHSVDVLLIIVAVNSNLTGGFKGSCYIGPNATTMVIWLMFHRTKFGFQFEILLFTIIHVKKIILRSFI